MGNVGVPVVEVACCHVPLAANFSLKEENELLRLRRLREDEAGCSFHGEGSQEIERLQENAASCHCFLGFIYIWPFLQ